MKQLVFIGTLLVVLCTIWVLFLEHEKERFEKSLPQVPQVLAPQLVEDTDASPAERDDVSGTSAGTLTSEDTAETAGTDTERSQEAAEPKIETPFLAEPLDWLSEPSPEDTAEGLLGYPRRPPEMSLAEWLERLSPAEREAVYEEKPWLKPIAEMTPQELEAEVVRQKQKRIDDYGNTPEVAIINKYTTVAMLRGEPLTFEGNEAIEYIRAMSVLWPSEGNVKAYREIEENIQNGGHATGSQEWNFVE